MLRFKVHRFQLGDRHFILLPKLNHGQVQVFVNRLTKLGYNVKVGRSLVAKGKGQTLHIEPSGYCWSAFDPADAILPAVPEALAVPKERLELDDLASMYLFPTSSGRASAFKLLTRIETSSLWDRLRKSGDCALSPDEHRFAQSILNDSSGRVTLLTSFSTSESVPKTIGRRLFFLTRLTTSEAGTTLRVAGVRSLRESYLLRDGMLDFEVRLPIQRRKLLDVFAGLDEWCGFSSA